VQSSAPGAAQHRHGGAHLRRGEQQPPRPDGDVG
jgi:hypothetical protein